MNWVLVTRVRKGFHQDSVALMRIARTVSELNGIEDAALMMGTSANLEILAHAGLLDNEAKTARGGDLVISIAGMDEEAVARGLARTEALLDRPGDAATGSGGWRPRTLRGGLGVIPEANLALISVPGDFAAAEARKAVRRGLHAMIFSDHVPLAEEADLKREALALGRLVMGPDCGTAIIAGVPLAFANSVPRGGIGIIGASGTGIQEVSCLIARQNRGVSHAIGVGGRDLSAEVGGISTLMALDALDCDVKTDQVVLISKPPPSAVAAIVLERVGRGSKPVTICFIGAAEMAMPANARQVFTLRDAAIMALGQPVPAGDRPASIFRRPVTRNFARGLFMGGTLAAEAQAVFLAAGLPVYSNVPVPGAEAMEGGEETDGNLILDMGDDAFTRGRPHPMIDPVVREEAVAAALRDPTVGVILADLVVGQGAHPDPARSLSEVVSNSPEVGRPEVIASVTGTDADPQVRAAQMATLEAVGISVAPTSADAAEWAAYAVGAKW